MSKIEIARRRWDECWTDWRNAMLASPRFQRFAALFPLTRPIAHRRARALFDLVAGFTYSQVLFACLEVRLFEALAQGASPLEEVARRTDLPRAGAERLLKAAAALGLTERLTSGRWTLGTAGAALRGNHGIAEMIAHHPLLYADLADPVALLRRGGGGGQLSSYWRYAEAAGDGSPDQVAGYSALMAASQPLVAGQILDAYPFHRHRRLLDIGGGEGGFLTVVAARAPKLSLGLFDLPAVVERAGARLAGAGCAGRTELFAGDFLADPLPEGHDLITLVRVLHDHDDQPALTLLRAVHAALPPGGRLLIAEPMAGTRGAEPAGDAYFGMYLLAMGSGRPRTPAEIRALLATAGFASSRVLRTTMPLTVRAIVAQA